MNVVHDSVFGRFALYLLLPLATWYEGSLLAVFLRGGTQLFRRLFAGSLLSRPFSGESAVSRAWGSSWLCRGVTVLVNIPGLLLHKLYRAFRPMWESSVAARFGFALVADTPVAIGWMMLLFLVIPYKQWNNAYSLLGFALMLVFAIFAGMRHSNQRLDVVALGPWTVFFGGLVMLGVPLSAYTGLSGRYLLYHLACMLCVLVIVSTVRNAAQLRRLAGTATVGLSIVSLYGIYQSIKGVKVNPSYVDLTLNKDMPGRIFSMFENPNAFAQVLVLLIPVALGLMFAARGWGGRFLGLCGAGLGSVAILLTYSRASWVGLAVGLFVFVFLWKKKVLPAILLLGLAALPFLPDSIWNRILTIFNFSDSSTSSRFPLYEAAGRLLAERPLQGAGLGSDAVRQGVSDLNLYFGKSPFVHAHNVYLQVWAELGIFGLISFLGSIGWALKRAGSIALRKLGGYEARMLIIGAASALVGIMICGIADYIWHYPRVMLIFWFVFALCAAGIRVALRTERVRALAKEEA